MTIRVLVVLAAGAFAGGLATAAEPAESLQIGMIQGMFRDVQPAMVQAMSKPLRDMIRKQTGLTGEVEICPDANVLAEKMKAKRRKAMKPNLGLAGRYLTRPEGRSVGR